ncbi:hypothetical protein [Thiohalocapsa halophila]|uniref:hypothetical protein n=1 Tax=Thiohalocapsa halophila TaxID=69359 RepID=UPI001905AC00|nr:hypothetical protein [Thiohalocapsa halophila]
MNLRNQNVVANTVEEQLVLEAIRRSNTELRDASITELGNYVRGLSDEQLRGLANNIKGIYHELLFLREYNSSHIDTQAELHESTSHPGSDIIIRDSETSEIVRRLQLKATDNDYYAAHGADRDPLIERVVTNEAANPTANVAPSGYWNSELEDDVTQQCDQLEQVSAIGQVGIGMETGGIVSGFLRAKDWANGRDTPGEAIKKFTADTAIAAGTTAFVAFLFS